MFLAPPEVIDGGAKDGCVLVGNIQTWTRLLGAQKRKQ